jgi:energy-coupling factor transport system ATP-binding protein
MIKIENLSLSFSKNKEVFSAIDCEFEKGKISLVSGKSGCGKSSLLMSLMRLIPGTIDGRVGGNILFKDRRINEVPTFEMADKMSYVFQDPESQLCTFTVEEELAFGLENLNVEPEVIREKIDYYLELLEIGFLKNRPLNSLSGGEKQLVAIATIIAMEPEVLILDEPTANLDPKMTNKIFSTIKKIQDLKQTTIIIVEHKIDEIIDWIDDIFWLEKKEMKKITKNELKKTIESVQLKTWEIKEEKTDICLQAKDISFSYGDADVLNNVSFELNYGQVLAIVGHNGAGKSTLFKIIMGLERCKSGEVWIGDSEIKDMSPCLIGSRMGLAFQNPEHQFLKDSVESELKFGMNSIDKKYEMERLEYYLKEFELEDVRLQNPFTLSQGQKRRLSTASIMIGGQKILLLDEPTYGQDRENLIKLMKSLESLRRDGKSVVMITHDLELVRKCCDKVVIINDGQSIFEGNREEFLAKASDDMGCIYGKNF